MAFSELYAGGTVLQATEMDAGWYPVSNQQRKQYIEYLAVGPTSFNVLFIVSFRSADRKWIEKALDILSQRHEILRTTYGYSNGEVYQKVHEGFSPAAELRYTDLVNSEQRDQAFWDLFHEAVDIKSDLTYGPIVHLRLVDLDGQTVKLLFCIHHISADGYSAELFKNELREICEALKAEKEFSRRMPAAQNRDFAAWVKQYLASEEGRAMMARYKEKVYESVMGETGRAVGEEDSYAAKLTKELSRFYPGSRPYWYEGIFGSVIQLEPNPCCTYQVYLDEPFLLKLNQAVLKYSCSLFIILIACYSLLFARLRQTRFTRFCVPTSLFRSSGEWSSVAGWLTAEVIICQIVDVNRTVGDFLLAVAENILSADEYQFYPFEKILSDLNYPGNITIPMFLNAQRARDSMIRDFRPGHQDSGDTKFEFEAGITECKNGISFRTVYNREAYSQEKMQALYKSYFELLNRLAACPKDELLLNVLS